MLIITLGLIIACGSKDEDDSGLAAEPSNEPAHDDTDSDSPESDSRCPSPEEDTCMTEELYQDCLEVAENCAGNILILESCPYGGFSCD